MDQHIIIAVQRLTFIISCAYILSAQRTAHSHMPCSAHMPHTPYRPSSMIIIIPKQTVHHTHTPIEGSFRQRGRICEQKTSSFYRISIVKMSIFLVTSVYIWAIHFHQMYAYRIVVGQQTKKKPSKFQYGCQKHHTHTHSACRIDSCIVFISRLLYMAALGPRDRRKN